MSAWIHPSSTSSGEVITGTFPRSTFGFAPSTPTGSIGRIRLSCIAPCPMISFTITTFFLPGCLRCSNSSVSTTRESSTFFNASRISCVITSVAVCAASGPGRSMLVPSLMITSVLMKISPFSGAPGRPHMMFSSRNPSEEPNSPI